MSTLAKLVGHDFAPGAEPSRFESLATTFGEIAGTAIVLLVVALVVVVLVRVLAAQFMPAQAHRGPEAEEPGLEAYAGGDSRSLRKAREAERDEALYAYRPDPELRAENRAT